MDPIAATVGFLRTAVVEMFDPFTLAAVTDSGAALDRTASRYQRTLEYVATIGAGDSKQAVDAATALMHIHKRIRGIEPISQQSYDANDPAGQLWILLTDWHSTLFSYEMVGPGPLSPSDDRRYWEECRRAAQFQTIDPETVPRSREEMTEYYKTVRPRLAASEATVRVIRHYLANADLMFERLPLRPPGMEFAVGNLISKATIATLPGYLRRMGGVQQSPLVGAAAVQALRTMHRMYRVSPRSPRLRAEALQILAPSAARVLVPRLLGVKPIEPVVVEPEVAWRREGKPLPREQYGGEDAALAS